MNKVVALEAINGIDKWDIETIKKHLPEWTRKAEAEASLPSLVKTSQLTQKEWETLQKILTLNVNEVIADDITGNVAKITEAFLRAHLTRNYMADITHLLESFDSRGKKVAPLLPFVAKIIEKLNSSAILEALELRKDQVGNYLASLPHDQSTQMLKDLTKIGYFKHESEKILEKIQNNVDFILADIQENREREKVAEIAVYFLLKRLHLFSTQNSDRYAWTSKRQAIIDIFYNLSIHIRDKFPLILEVLTDIFHHDRDSLHSIVVSLGQPGNEHIPELLRIATKIANIEGKYSEEVIRYPLFLLRKESIKPTINELDSLPRALSSIESTDAIKDTVIELIGRMDRDVTTATIPYLISSACNVPTDRIKKLVELLKQIGVPRELDRLKIRGWVNLWRKYDKSAELAALSLSMMKNPTSEDIDAIIGLKDGSPTLRIACVHALSRMKVKSDLVFNTLQQLAIDIDKTVREPALQTLYFHEYFTKDEGSAAIRLLTGRLPDITPVTTDVVQKSPFLKELITCYARKAFEHIQNFEKSEGYSDICSVLMQAGMLTYEDAIVWGIFATDKNLKNEKYQGPAIPPDVRKLLGEATDIFSIPSKLISQKRLTNRLANWCFFGKEGLKGAVELLCKIYEDDPEKITKEHLDILADMGIHLDEKDLKDFFNLLHDGYRLAGIGPDVKINTIPLLWSLDSGEFIDAELEKLKAGFNIFTGPLAKTLTDILLKKPEDYTHDMINVIIGNVQCANKNLSNRSLDMIRTILLELASASNSEAINSSMTHLAGTLRDLEFKDFKLNTP